MWTKFVAAILLGSTSVAATGAAMMSAPKQTQTPCRVTGGDKLPAETGGPGAICAAVVRAVAAQAPNIRYSAEIRVVSKSSLAADLTVNGKALPEQRFSVSDRNLNALAIEHFANGVAAALAGASRS